MSKKAKLQCREGSKYHQVISFMRETKVYDKAVVHAFCEKNGISTGTGDVCLSPKHKTQTKGDPCGNISAPLGFYNEKLKKVKGEAQRFRFRLYKDGEQPTRTSARKEKADGVESTQSKAKDKKAATVSA